ncbi:unnamed protein product [Sphenostylis stenocarpa]|uniref:Uncharacterized protein n=1 Tax=Sphenostylis stenocarpa TaxID=92480 RepID=A0AA86W1T4_9FABA|nr:unnamed protein product [Sphenostylis stenocarpa]
MHPHDCRCTHEAHHGGRRGAHRRRVWRKNDEAIMIERKGDAYLWFQGALMKTEVGEDEDPKHAHEGNSKLKKDPEKKEVGFGSIWDQTILFSLTVSSRFSDSWETLVK